MLFWNFAFAAVIAWLLYAALKSRIDSAMGQLKHDITLEMGNLKQRPQLAAGEDLKQRPEEAPKNETLKNDLDVRIRKQVLQDCPRYGIHDAYTISEPARFYEREDGRGRIRLLRRVYTQGIYLPYELALKAVTDSDPLVREWMARESPYLDYREARHKGADGQFTTTYLHPDRNLIERLRQDSDPFIRAVLRENPEISDFGIFDCRWLEEFRNCVPLERLAMMRNKKLHFDLVNRILDVDDTELNLEKGERFQLARACLVNTNVVQNGRRSRTTDFADGWGWYQSRKNSKTVWGHAAKWPEDSGIQVFAFKYVQTEDKVKADIYPKCQAAYLRVTILESCLPEDKETLRLGRGDTDSTARYIAYGRSRYMDRQEIEDVLRREKDKVAIGALLENPWQGSIARELHKAIEDTQEQPLPAAGPDLIEAD
jgi:hypothetical protein